MNVPIVKHWVGRREKEWVQRLIDVTVQCYVMVYLCQQRNRLYGTNTVWFWFCSSSLVLGFAMQILDICVWRPLSSDGTARSSNLPNGLHGSLPLLCHHLPGIVTGCVVSYYFVKLTNRFLPDFYHVNLHMSLGCGDT